ncbi:L,D-transpeptidase-like protein [Thiogranum longum]|uniref:L,D-transpeptidase-like protein n=1 Tax=Thiogranum longum TaxID=1537524 RepID=A0A4R1HCU5_9GAMM|nr:L,D-transpeptidase-like protein [Thiogranum longum]
MPPSRLEVSLADQRLDLFRGHECVRSWPVSTAKKGAGEQSGSEKTPRGWHRIRAMIGAGCPAGTVFVGRRPTGEVWTPELGKEHPQRDWILTRILWLSGNEPGVNRLGDVDTQRRYIYIHGCPDSEPLGEALSHGCIRMHNRDVITLFDAVTPGFPVLIKSPDQEST